MSSLRDQPAFALLAEHTSARPTVAQWLRSAWPDWYGPGGNGDAEDDVRRYSQVDQLPLGVLAFARGLPCGFGALKFDSVPGFEHAAPWLGAGYVIPSMRRLGVGLGLVHALQAQAKRLGYTSVFCATATAHALMGRAGWANAGISVLGGKQVGVYRVTV